MYCEVERVLINRDKYMNEIFKYLKDKEKLKLALEINSAMQGRNYIKEFPESISFLESRICAIVDGSNPYRDPSVSCPNISIESEQFPEFEHWRFCFDEGEVYVTNFVKGDHISLFRPSDLNNVKLRSIICEEVEYVDDWLLELFDDMRNRSSK